MKCASFFVSVARPAMLRTFYLAHFFQDCLSCHWSLQLGCAVLHLMYSTHSSTYVLFSSTGTTRTGTLVNKTLLQERGSRMRVLSHAGWRPQCCRQEQLRYRTGTSTSYCTVLPVSISTYSTTYYGTYCTVP